MGQCFGRALTWNTEMAELYGDLDVDLKEKFRCEWAMVKDFSFTEESIEKSHSWSRSQGTNGKYVNYTQLCNEYGGHMVQDACNEANVHKLRCEELQGIFLSKNTMTNTVSYLYLSQFLSETSTEAWRKIAKAEMQDNKWKMLATECKARRNYAAYHGQPFAAVTVKDVEDSSAGVEGWATTQVVLAGKAPGAAASAKGKAKAKAKPKACAAKTAAGAATPNSENQARDLLAKYQLCENLMARVSKKIMESPEDWKWSEADMSGYLATKKEFLAACEVGDLSTFLEDFKAAIYSSTASRKLKKDCGENFEKHLKRFTLQTAHLIDKLVAIQECITNTANARKLSSTEETPEKASRSRGSSAGAAAQPVVKRSKKVAP